jgi:hypothetical protein
MAAAPVIHARLLILVIFRFPRWRVISVRVSRMRCSVQRNAHKVVPMQKLDRVARNGAPLIRDRQELGA